ncbi:hypothetical protein [Pontibacter sp. G13]|uniref:hypothetical protein n=1 Tax=Pontibacter sp. G13 TaxID=3074898 RepID=UPI00288A9CAD|nr:hypothetical protein [Pontibacter sp. G13]WNJ18285.1 hypothetical protein RJD25_25820 [Pontibacter sp. G13]
MLNTFSWRWTASSGGAVIACMCLLGLLSQCDSPSEQVMHHCPVYSLDSASFFRFSATYDPSLEHPVFGNFDSIRKSRTGGILALTDKEIQNKAAIGMQVYGSGHDSLEVCTCLLTDTGIHLEIASLKNESGGVFLELKGDMDSMSVSCRITSDHRPVRWIPLRVGQMVLQDSAYRVGDTLLGVLDIESGPYMWSDTCIESRLYGGFRCVIWEEMEARE